MARFDRQTTALDLQIELANPEPDAKRYPWSLVDRVVDSKQMVRLDVAIAWQLVLANRMRLRLLPTIYGAYFDALVKKFEAYTVDASWVFLGLEKLGINLGKFLAEFGHMGRLLIDFVAYHVELRANFIRANSMLRLTDFAVKGARADALTQKDRKRKRRKVYSRN